MMTMIMTNNSIGVRSCGSSLLLFLDLVFVNAWQQTRQFGRVAWEWLCSEEVVLQCSLRSDALVWRCKKLFKEINSLRIPVFKDTPQLILLI